MLYLGIDLHRKQMTVSLRNPNGDVLLRRQVSTRWPKVEEFRDQLHQALAAAEKYVAVVEVCGFHDWLVHWLRQDERCEQVLVVQPLGRAWRRVYLGLGLIKWGTVAALAALAFNVLVVLAGPSHRPAAVRTSLPTDDHVGLLAIAIPSALSVVFSLLGRLCCCSVPAGSGARLAATVSL